MLFLLMKGFPGSGKSALSRALSRRLAWPLIDKDDVKDVAEQYLQGTSNDLSYDVMLNIVRRQLLQGLNVICDSPLTHYMTYKHAKAIATETHASLAIVECVCSDERIWSQRINGRKQHHLPQHHMTDWERVQAYRHQFAIEANFAITNPHLVVDTVRPLEECVADVTEWLQVIFAIKTQ